MLGETVIRALSTFPRVSCALLRGYLRVGAPVPSRAAWVVWRLQRQLVPQSSIRTVSIGNKLQLRVDVKSTIGREIFYYGSYEPQLAKVVKQVLKPGATCIDAGENLGELTVRLAKLVGKEGKVYALEASPETVEDLRYNVSLNGLSNVCVMWSAVCESNVSQTFYLGQDKDSLASSLSVPANYSSRMITVPGLCLDTLVEKQKLPRIDLIKMDIEGAELAALHGGENLLRYQKPAPVLVFEYNHQVALRA
jgi:FkbM family methyltransferase